LRTHGVDNTCKTHGGDALKNTYMPPWGWRNVTRMGVTVKLLTLVSPWGGQIMSTPWAVALREAVNPMGPGTQRVNSKSMFTMCNATSPPLAHVGIPRLRDATELNSDDMIKFVDVHYQTQPNLSFFSERDLINDDSSFCLLIHSSIIDLLCFFFVLKSFR